MLVVSSRSPRMALLTPPSARFPSKSTKNRYSHGRSSIGLDSILGKVQVIEDKVGQHLIQRSALMWKLKADTDLVRVF